MNKLLKLSLLCVAAVAITAVPAFATEGVVTAPEPASLLLLVSGVASIALARKFRK